MLIIKKILMYSFAQKSIGFDFFQSIKIDIFLL